MLSNLLILTLSFTVLLFFVQRIERRRFWLALLVLLPAYLIYRWAMYRGELNVMLIALGIGVGINLIYWLFYGRRHPPQSSNEITVKGMED